MEITVYLNTEGVLAVMQEKPNFPVCCKFSREAPFSIPVKINQQDYCVTGDRDNLWLAPLDRREQQRQVECCLPGDGRQS